MSEEILLAFKNAEDENELDISSCDVNDFPLDVFKLPLERLNILTLDYNHIENIPASISTLCWVTHLSIIGNYLIDLPNEITGLKNLQSLVLDENEICMLPECIGNLKSLINLSVIGNKLQKLPDSFTNLENLEELYLDENSICYLPLGWNGMKSLVTFEISNNMLTSIPFDIGDLNQLKILNCNYNAIGKLPESFSTLQNLEILDLSNNKLEELPEAFESARVIEKLYLENNALKFVPPWFSELHQLRELTIADNALCLEPFDDSFCENTTKLKKLEAGGNFMTSLSVKFGCLVNLENLHLGSTISELERSNFQNGNWIKVLPESFCSLCNLKRANMNENQISKLPDKFGVLLLNLSWLDLGQNMLEYLPDSICKLINLEFFQLSKNQLKELPINIGSLQNLIDLRLDNNLLTVIPESLSEVKSLRSLDLFHNLLTEIPPVVYKLKNLKRLDLDQNCFSVKLAEVPKITPGNNYPERDPSLKDNWRGKTRPDKLPVNNVIDVNIEVTGSDDDEEENVGWNHAALQVAMQRGMSMWRSHTGSEQREIETKEPEKHKHIDNDDEWEAMTFSIGSKAYLPGITTQRIKKVEKSDPCEEDWDQEIEESKQYSGVVETCYERKFKNSSVIDDFQNCINRYPPSQQAYSTTGEYESFVYRKHDHVVVNGQDLKSSMIVADGQFDDVE